MPSENIRTPYIGFMMFVGSIQKGNTRKIWVKLSKIQLFDNYLATTVSIVNFEHVIVGRVATKRAILVIIQETRN